MAGNVVGRAVLTISGEMDKASMAAAGKQAESTLAKTGKSMTQLGSQLTKSVTLPLVGLGALAVKEFSGFEQSMFRINQLAGVSKEELDKITPSIRDIGVAAGIGPTEAADAFFFLQSGIGDTEVALEALDVSARASAAGLGTVEDISSSVVSAIRGYGAENLSAAEAVDIFGAAAKNAVFGPDELAGALQSVIPNAALMGAELDELAGITALISPAFGSASEATNALNGVFNAVQKGGKPLADALASVGTDAEGLQKVIGEQGLAAGFELMEKASEESGTSLVKMLGRSEAARAAVSFLAQDSKTVAGVFDDTANAAGFVDGAFAEMSETTQFQLKEAVASLKDALIDFGGIVAPVIASVASGFSSLGSALSGMSSGAKTAIVIGAAIAAALGPVLIIIGTLITSISAIAGVFAGMSLAVAAPIAAIAALGVGIGLLLAKSESFRAAVVSGFGQIRAAIMPVLTEISAVIKTQLIPAWEAIAPVVLPVLEKIAVFLVNTLIAGLKGVIQAIQGFVQIFSGAINVIAGVLTGDWSRAWEGVKKIFSGAINVISGAFKAFLNLSILGIVRKVFVGAVVKLITGGWRAIINMFKRSIKAVGSAMRSGMSLYLKIWSLIFKGIGRAVSSGIRLVVALVKGWVNLLRSIFTGIGPALGSLMSRAWGLVKNAVTKGISSVVGLVKSLPGKAKSALGNVGSTLLSAGVSLITGFINGIRSAAGRIVGAIKTYVTDKIPGPVKKALGISSPSKVFRNIGRDVIRGLVLGLQRNSSKAEKAVDRVSKAIRKALTDKKITTAAAKRMRQTLRALAKEADKMRKTLAEKLDFSKEIRGALAGEGSLSSIFEGDGAPTTIEGVTFAVSGIVARIKAFTKKLGLLAKAGIPPALIREVAGLGSEQGSLVADVLLNSNKQQRNAFRKSYRDLQKFSRQAGNVAATGVFGTNKQIRRPLRESLGVRRRSQQPKRRKDRLGDVRVTQNFFGPTTSGGRLREIEWTLRYATSGRRETVDGVAT